MPCFFPTNLLTLLNLSSAHVIQLLLVSTYCKVVCIRQAAPIVELFASFSTHASLLSPKKDRKAQHP